MGFDFSKAQIQEDGIFDFLSYKEIIIKDLISFLENLLKNENLYYTNIGHIIEKGDDNNTIIKIQGNNSYRGSYDCSIKYDLIEITLNINTNTIGVYKWLGHDNEFNNYDQNNFYKFLKYIKETSIFYIKKPCILIPNLISEFANDFIWHYPYFQLFIELLKPTHKRIRIRRLNIKDAPSTISKDDIIQLLYSKNISPQFQTFDKIHPNRIYFI